MDSEDGPGQDAEVTRFARTLNALKRRGSSLLVVGVVPDEMYERASRQMLGDERAPAPRRRLVVSDDPNAGDRLAGTGPTTPEYARVIARDTAARSAAAATGGSTSPTMSLGGPKIHHIDSSLPELGTKMTEVLHQFDAAANGLDSAELRVAFDCLSTLEAEHEPETVFRFLHIATNQIRTRTGMGHFRLPRAVDERPVRTYAPLFDAIIELRVDVGDLQQRWHFVEEGFVSEWLAVPE